MDRTRCGIWLTLMGGLLACSSSSPSKVDGSEQLTEVPAGQGGTGKGGQTGSGGATGSGGLQSDALGGGGAAKDSGAGGSGGVGGTSTGGLVDAALGGGLGSGGQSGLGGSGGLGGGLGGGGQLGSGGGTGGVIASGGQAGGNGGGLGGSMAGTGGTTIAADAGLGGVSGSGGQTVGSGGGGGGLGTDAGVSLDVFRSEIPHATCGTLTATIGGSATEDSSMQRYAVSGADCHKYIVQNNNFADPTGNVQTLTISGASFEVVSSNAYTSSLNVPASFPSIYIGGNGKIANGAYATWEDSTLPIRISALGQAMTSFAWSGGVADGDFAASYDVWFAKGPPVEGAYDDAISGSLMIWLNQPRPRQPAGAVVRQATVAGHAWDVWVGPHGSTATGTDDANRPIVSYVAQDGPLHSLAFDLANFIADAVSNGGADMSAARTSQAFSSTWYLTDVIAGFQIWTGSDAAGLKCSSFACQVKK